MTFTSAPLALRNVENVCRKVVTRSIYRSVVGKCKTEASRKRVPLDPWVVEKLLIGELLLPTTSRTTGSLAVHGPKDSDRINRT